MIMEKLGQSIDELYKQEQRQFSMMTLLLVVDKMLDRIRDIHERGVIHRDIKPDNIMVNHNDEAILIDFGVSALFDGEDDQMSHNMGT